MRLVLCIKRDLHGCVFLNHLLPALGGHHVWLLLSDKNRQHEDENPILAEMKFLERTLPLNILFPNLNHDRSQRFLPFELLAKRHGMPMEIVQDINGAAMRGRLTEYHPDLIISARFSLIFKPETIGIPTHGIVNIHPGALPEFAGLFAPMRTVMAGRDELSCSVHSLDAGIDTGPLLAIRSMPYRKEEGLLSQIAELYPLAIPYLTEMIAGLEQGKEPVGHPQDRTLRQYRSMPTAAELEAFLEAGHRFWHPAGYQRLLYSFLAHSGDTPA